ncbi:MAG: ABC transporter permease [Caulobacter sp.]|nr:ABC transporter permease [Caulobacter sp.]
MRRLLQIAAREYVAYVRTVGFWLSMLALPLGMALVMGASGYMEASAPPPAIVLVDRTPGQIYQQPVTAALTTPGGLRERPRHEVVAPPVALPGDTAAIGAALKPWLAGEARLPGKRKLAAAYVIHGQGEAVAVDVWTDNPLLGATAKIRQTVADQMQQSRLVAAGISPATLAEIRALEPRITDWSPKTSQKASLLNRLPGVIGFGAAMLLWSVIFTGAGILLNGVIEEKSSKVLEVLLSSATVPEILFGKILGVAGVTFTVLGVWGGVGALLMSLFAPAQAADVGRVLLSGGLIFYFAFYLVCGYLMYASVFTAIGSFCETTREAQTLLGPIMILLTIPVIFLSQALRRPDTPALDILSWIPPFTPFMMTARAASNPPLWQVVGTGAIMLATVAVVVWIAGRAFRAGALSTGKVDLKGLVAKLRGGE